MRNRSIPLRLDRPLNVRLLLTAVMSVILAVMVLINSQYAMAQTMGGEPVGPTRDEIVAELDTRYSEKPVAGGVTAGGAVLEVFATADGASWTIIITQPNGVSSVVAEGEGWAFIKKLAGLQV